VKFASIGSGSEGNGTLVEFGGTLLLVDCGFSARETERRLVRWGVSPADISAILVTHEHADHVRGAPLFSRRHGIPVYLTWGTYSCKAFREKPIDEEMVNIITPDNSFNIGEIEIMPIPVPHDAREPVQFVFLANGLQLGLLTDSGHITSHMRSVYKSCDGLFLECNHDLDMLVNGPYPVALKRRVAGNYGHLSNHQAAGLLRDIDVERVQHLVVSHVSKHNNHLDLVMDALKVNLEYGSLPIKVADQKDGLAWQQLVPAKVVCG